MEKTYELGIYIPGQAPLAEIKILTIEELRERYPSHKVVSTSSPRSASPEELASSLHQPADQKIEEPQGESRRQTPPRNIINL